MEEFHSVSPPSREIDSAKVAGYLIRMTTAELQAIVDEPAISQTGTDRQIKEPGKQIGGLGHEFGSFAQGLSYAFIEKILGEDFDLNEYVILAVKMRKGGREEEYYVLAYSNGTIDKAIIVEFKSKLRQEDVDQMKRKMDEVVYWMPEHKDKAFYGTIAYVSDHSDLRRQVIENGWHLACM